MSTARRVHLCISLEELSKSSNLVVQEYLYEGVMGDRGERYNILFEDIIGPR